jgi:hypothetical protein
MANVFLFVAKIKCVMKAHASVLKDIIMFMEDAINVPQEVTTLQHI